MLLDRGMDSTHVLLIHWLPRLAADDEQPDRGREVRECLDEQEQPFARAPQAKEAHDDILVADPQRGTPRTTLVAGRWPRQDIAADRDDRRSDWSGCAKQAG